MYDSFRNSQLREAEQASQFFKNYFQLARSPTAHFLSVRACAGTIPPWTARKQDSYRCRFCFGGSKDVFERKGDAAAPSVSPMSGSSS